VPGMGPPFTADASVGISAPMAKALAAKQAIRDLGNMAPPPSRRLYWKMGRASPLSTGRDACFTVRDANGQALALVLFPGGAWPPAAADVARRIAANNGKLQICCPRWISVTREASFDEAKAYWTDWAQRHLSRHSPVHIQPTQSVPAALAVTQHAQRATANEPRLRSTAPVLLASANPAAPTETRLAGKRPSPIFLCKVYQPPEIQ
jgi:hypothetical protein